MSEFDLYKGDGFKLCLSTINMKTNVESVEEPYLLTLRSSGKKARVLDTSFVLPQNQYLERLESIVLQELENSSNAKNARPNLVRQMTNTFMKTIDYVRNAGRRL